jgi:hypothetical protein
MTSADADAMRRKRPSLTPEQRAAAAFIAELSAELLEVARSHRFRHLAYLLDLATLEAKNLTRRDAGPPEASAPVPLRGDAPE